MLADLEAVDAERYLLHQIEIQRRILIEGRSYVGAVGEVIEPSAIQWPKTSSLI